MELPVETSQKFINKQITFDAVSLRSDVDVNPKFYITGIKLLNLDSKDEEIIEQLILRVGFQD